MTPTTPQEAGEPALSDFLDGYLRPMVKRHEMTVLRLRGELRRAEADLNAVRHVIQMLTTPAKDKPHDKE